MSFEERVPRGDPDAEKDRTRTVVERTPLA